MSGTGTTLRSSLCQAHDVDFGEISLRLMTGGPAALTLDEVSWLIDQAKAAVFLEAALADISARRREVPR